ncbi:alkaline phosphatase family protein [Phycisphaeraceae bacterium D3-23]
MQGSRKLLMIGWDAADWQVIDPLLEQGKMPHLAGLIEGGVRGNLASLQPMLSPMLWTTIATGKRPHKHGIHGFIEPLPDRTGVRPVTSTSRTTRAIWNILTHRGMHSNTVGWFASHPAEPIHGVCVSNLLQRGCPSDKKWHVPDHAIHPAALAEPLGKLRIHADDLQHSDLSPFVPSLAGQKVEDENLAKGLAALARLLAEMATVQSVATAVLEQEPWDASFIYFDAIDHFCHSFMYHRPPKLPQIDPLLYEAFKDTVDGVYQLQDMMLGRALDFCNDDTTVIICSDHGFLNDHLRPAAIPDGPQGPAVWHRFHGMVVMKGPGIRRGEQLYGASILDLCPTMLSVLGLPVGEDMDGKLLAAAFDAPPDTGTIPSWDDLEGGFGEHTQALRVDPVAAAEAIQQMVDLGYVDAMPEKVEDTVALAVRELKFNLAMALADAMKFGESLSLLEELARQYPDQAKYRAAIAEHALEAGDPSLAREHLDAAFAARAQAEAEGTKLPPAPQLHLQLAQVLYAEHRYAEAMAQFRTAEDLAPNSPKLLLRVGIAHTGQRDYVQAERVFHRVLEIDPNEPVAYYGLARVAMRLRQYEQAVDHALSAVGLRHHLLGGHLMLALALARLSHVTEAIAAANTALALRPQFRPAHRLLVRLHHLAGSEPLADYHRGQLRAIGEAIEQRRQRAAERE